MEETYSLIKQYLGIGMFILAITMLLNYISQYNKAFDELLDRAVRDTVIAETKIGSDN